MHRLDWVEIRNFRSCREVRVELSDITPLVGRNNTGKSNILRAIAWLLRFESLDASDFFEETTGVEVRGLVSGIDDGILAKLIDTHKTKLTPHVQNGTLTIRRLQAKPRDTKTKAPLKIRNSKVADEGADDAWHNPAGIEEAIQALLPEPIEIGAMEVVADDCAKQKASNTLGKLVKEISTTTIERLKGEYSAAMMPVSAKLAADGDARDESLKNLDSMVTGKLNEMYRDLQLRVHVPVPDMKTLLSSCTIRVSEGNTDVWRDLDEMGHGAQRSIQMALVRQLAESTPADGADGGSRTLLLIDEPELYQHPQAVALILQSLRKLSEGRFQVVFATHSPLLVHEEQAARTVIVRKPSGSPTKVAETMRASVNKVVEETVAQTRLLFELQNAAETFFSDKVLLIEGNTERVLLPTIYRKLRNATMLERSIGLVPVDSSSSLHRAIRVAEAMGIDVRAVADLDFAFRVAPGAGLVPDADELLREAKAWFAANAGQHGIELADDGFPQNGNGKTAAQGFAEFAKSPVGEEIAGKMHVLLLGKSIWLWTSGCFEDQFAWPLESKREAYLRDQARKVRDEATDEQLECFRPLVDWLDPPQAGTDAARQ
jgi:putative ATP-dependent endonuclease of OLD family